MESIFLQLKEKHGNTYSGPQLRLWVRMVVAKAHTDMDDPPRVPMVTGMVHKQPHKGSLTDAFACAATAIAKELSPTSANSGSTHDQVAFSPSKKIDLRLKTYRAATCMPVATAPRRWDPESRRVYFPEANSFRSPGLNNHLMCCRTVIRVYTTSGSGY